MKMRGVLRSMPCDRPKLSKGYLAGTASEESNLLRSANFYRDHDIDLRLATRVAVIDVKNQHVELADGNRGKTTGTGYRVLPNASDQVNNPNKILALAPIRRGGAVL